MSITRLQRSRRVGTPLQQTPGTPFSVMNRPTMSFDDSNRENYIMRSSRGLPTLFDRAKDVAPIQIFPPNPDPNIIVDYEKGKGGRDSSMLPNFTATIEPVLDVTPGPVDMMPSPVDPLPADSLQDKLRDLLDINPTDAPQGQVFMAGGLPFIRRLPFNLFQDPTADGGIIDYFSRKLFGDDDPENDFDYEPLPDDFKGELPPGSMTETLEASADTYTLPNLLQMLQDARDAGNEDEIELLTNDLEMLFPGSTMTI
jgi:hypothetical protein